MRRALAALLLGAAVLLPGCLEGAFDEGQPREPYDWERPPEQGEGAFDPWQGPTESLTVHWSPAFLQAREGDRCLRMTGSPNLSAFRPGYPLGVAVLVENCGNVTLHLTSPCPPDLPRARLRHRGFEWALGEDGRARGTREECNLPGDHPGREPRPLLPHEALTRTVRWNGFLAADPCGAESRRTGSVLAAPGVYLLDFRLGTLEGLFLNTSTPVQMMDTSYEGLPLWPEGNGTFRTLLLEDSMSGIKAPRTAVIENQAAWVEFCRDHVPWREVRPLGFPYLDFTKERIVVAARGEAPSTCHVTRITNVTYQGNFSRYVVEVTNYEPRASQACGDAVMSPVHAVSIPRGGPVIFHNRTVVGSPPDWLQ
ncbi:MAG TPA: hypothetical protein VNZ52_00060 [Candidatus Thermoplasmatota archaeon]|nr:hypothetical protein [Candidatus Thermoplasmatota archaeon]